MTQTQPNNLFAPTQVQLTPYEIVAIRDSADRLNEVLKILKPREQAVLDYRFGLNGRTFKTLREVGKAFKVSATRIREIESMALRKLRHPTYLNKLDQPI